MKKILRRQTSMVHDQSGSRPSLQDCLEAVLMQSDNLIEEVLEGLAKAAAPSEVKRSYGGSFPVSKAVADLLLMQADSIKATFKAQLRLGLFNMGSQHLGEQPSLRFDDLQQLDAQKIDASIEFAMAQQEVLRCVDDLLPALDAIVSSLLGWITVQPQLNPLKPEVFVQVLQASLAEHAPGERARAALITPAAGLLGVGLRRLYREVCNWLRSQGIEPASAVGALQGAHAAKGKGGENAVSRALVTLDKLRKLLSGELGSGQGNVVGQDFLHTVPACYDALEDLKLIEPMMKRLAQRANLPVVASAPVEAAAQPVSREPTQGKQLGKQLGAEVVRLMLDNLMQDERLLREVRALIKTLEPVLLALSDADPRFFSERQHPARQFLDRVTHRSLGYTSENDEGFSRFLGSISESVKALSGGDGDAAAFGQALRQLDAGWALEEVTQRQQQEEAARALLHVEQRNLLAQRLADEFSQQQKDKKIPEMVSAFLRGPWAQVVAESQLGCANGSADSAGYLALVDDLLWSVQPQLTRRNRVRLVELVPNLLVKLRHGLQLIGYPEERIPVLFDALITLHEMAFEGRRLAPLAIAAQPAARAIGELLVQDNLMDLPELSDEEGFWVADDETQESGYVMTDAQAQAGVDVQRPWSAGELNPGAWVELIVDDVWLRAQLTWASPHRTLFMFISRGGVAHSMSRRSMERLRMNGRIRLISDGHVLDNALDAVAQTALQNELGWAHKQP
ncbi:MAG: DUF1631 domain-containing protein [Gammaproteobacteria bacterium]|uniref:DUF1631 family protein n=1 Tax=Rhodoferax sp. TaxID=50421 RepID=UPI00184D55C9|nr:DUF1631 family protein [Rhodoferax sp.]MBU3899491.1 DUF1631 domain-containing protein [Gammaproteobacteria bacterium]MBA3059561.1 DUF1631 domain-containing protein [Rhodoferax sp.]MBU3998696.1 DUF1631 domain-containing protein [Gammaproteobacteria bacterium]MBU4017967.1 DUF1631 domain-containing protein [Gammaproteobacteria bacterium]MBU4080343.1 DUF1631 domain-containing protein [Gammaproteobacteria bacterium]